MRNYLSIFLILCISLSSIAQEEAPKIKFGKVSNDELLMSSYAKDTSADAVVLFDKGELYFEYNNIVTPKRFQYNYKRHLRIKIFNKEALSFGNHNIYLYHANSRSEKLEEFKAYSFNLEDGKVIKDKVSKKDLLQEEYDKNRDIAKCIMPNVKEGTIIDITYTIQSDYLHYLRSWQFQYNVPVEWSEFRAVVPQFYIYNHYFKGFYDLVISDTKSQVDELFKITSEDKSAPAGSPRYYNWDLESRSSVFHFAAKDIPAFKDEPFMPSEENYLFKLQFELSATNFPRSPIDYYAQTWESVNEELMKDSRFGALIRPSVLLGNHIKSIVDKNDDDVTKMLRVFNYVKNNYKWNGKNRYYGTYTGFKKIIDEKAGTSADLNLLLIGLLREAGLTSYPIALSTRSNGMIVPEYPGENAFDYVIAYVKIDDNYYLLDATDKYSLPNLLPTRCLNGKARLLNEKFTEWIDIKAPNTSKKIVSGTFIINADESTLDGKFLTKRDNYFAHFYRKTIKDYTDIEKYMEEYENKNHNFEIEEYDFKGVDTLHQPIEMNLKLSINESINQAGDLLYFNPLNVFTGEENPFKSETRDYPVNFPYTTNETYIMNYQLPDGYVVNELPEDVKMELPDNKASFLYSVNQNGNFLRVTFIKEINNTIFSTNEYKNLRDLFNKMISKQSEQIVLKKTI